MDLGLRGTTILVTGASGGIGSAVARTLAGEDVHVAVHYHRNRDAAEEIAAEIDGHVVGGDLRDEDEVARVVAEASAPTGRLDGCVANAGVWPREDVPVVDMALDRWRATLDANLTATFLTARAYLRHVRTVGRGSLVMTASTAGRFGEAGHADYAAAKAAMAYGLLLSLKNEVVALGPSVRVNAVAPGWTVSPMTARDLDQTTIDHVTATMPLRKVATPEDVAAAVVYLLSPTAAGHVTGELITVAGGMEGRLLR